VREKKRVPEEKDINIRREREGSMSSRGREKYREEEKKEEEKKEEEKKEEEKKEEERKTDR